jgi:hypothetical protein
MAGSLESRLGNIEELCIIIIIIIFGGGGRPGVGPGPSDSVTTDTARAEALMRLIRRPPIGDSFTPEVSRMSLEGIEARLLEVNSELTRLRSHEAELNTRLKELRGGKTK